MMVKGFEVWKVAVRLLPKRFDTTKTQSGRNDEDGSSVALSCQVTGCSSL
jgi:hypothetical protein